MLRRFVLAALVASSCGCGESSLSSLKDEFSGGSFYYLDAVDRAQTMTDLKDLTLANYTLLDIKKARGIVPDGNALFDQAIAREQELGNADDSDALAQATSNVQFLDRIQAVIGSFQDTHFSSSALVLRPTVLNGLYLARVGEEIRIVGTRPKVISYVKTLAANPSTYDALKAGAKVVAIDGVPALDAAAALLPFISGSTRAMAQNRAAAHLASRRYAMPERAYADWTIESQGGETTTLRLPYFYTDTSRRDALVYLKAKGFKPLADLTLDFDEQSDDWTHSRPVGITGYDPYGAPADMVGGKTWFGVTEEGTAVDKAYRTGYLLKDGKAYGVLQFYTFGVYEVVPTAGDVTQGKVAVMKPIIDFVKQLKASKTPLILDLRTNGGGDPGLAISLLAVIAKTDAVYPSTSRALRVTRLIRQMLEADPEQLPVFSGFDYDQTAFAELQKAVAAHKPYTSAFSLTDDVRPDAQVGGYDEKIVALIAPDCISACDGMGMLLKTSGRATLIGTTTNGTGAGFIGGGVFEDVQARDRNQLVSLRIPNRLFGPGGPVGQRVFDAPDAYLTMNGENRPTVADLEYQETVRDFTGAAAGWYETALSALQ